MLTRSSLPRVATFLASLATLGASAPALRLKARDSSFDYNNNLIYGVNLGGWLVCEPWITPSIFEAAGDSAVDEYTLGELGYDLTSHWETWITEDDFSNIAAAGLNHVRIPIGYWSVIQQSPYNYGAIDYLDSAVQWARTYGLHVLVDLHGASVSQNGFDNSGHYGAVEWGSSESYSDTLNAVAALAQRYKGDTDVVSLIEVLNEPLTNTANTYIQLDELEQFYRDGWGRIHNDASSDFTVVVHDAFQGVSAWYDWGNDLSGVMIDTHIYYIFDDSKLAQSQSDRISSVCSYKSTLAESNKWAIVGEWCSATTDCAKYLNGRYKGSRTDGTYDSDGAIGVGSCDGYYSGSVDSLTNDQKATIRQMNEAQLDSYASRNGWVYWTWKTEGAPEWDLQAQINAGLFPQPLSDRQYGTQC
ncbi:putative exo-beta-glucanase [Phaeomoniella chlamydospora]|uniref:glucan 1,3-beta-glucosidase n=1 Tax=Phaeomoniella chlamydospora TaxID=158046 RepID=A0A0G2ESZ6_PHACM|nr:putative exo-beta-glucanase [Phaeomoniella chlamydospora]